MFLIAIPTCVNAGDGPPGVDNWRATMPPESEITAARQRLAAGERLFERVIVRNPNESFGGAGQREIVFSARTAPTTVIIDPLASQTTDLPLQPTAGFSDITFIRIEPTVRDVQIISAERIIAPLQNQREEATLSSNNTINFDSGMISPVSDELSRVSPAFTQEFDSSSFHNFEMPDDLAYPNGDISNGIIDEIDNRNVTVERAEEVIFSTYGITPEEAFGSFGYTGNELNSEDDKSSR